MIKAIRTIPEQKYLCIEEGTQSAWLLKTATDRDNPKVWGLN